MARAIFVKKAQKDNPVAKKGESYYWWKFRFGGKHYSKEAPKASQLTSSAFLSQAYDLNDQLAAFTCTTIEDTKDQIQELSDKARELGEECTNNLDNMPEALQESPTGELLTERASAMEELADNLDSVDTDIDERGEEETEDSYNERFAERIEEINSEISALQYEGE